MDMPKLKYYFSNFTYQAVIVRKDNGNLTEAQAVEVIRRVEAHDGLVVACRFAKSHIKQGSQKKALPILRQALSGEPK